MLGYVLRRLILAVPTLIGVTFIVFALVRFLPGDAVDVLVQEYRYAPTRDAIRERLGLNEPIYQQYGKWLANLVRGDFGTSLITRRNGSSELKRTFPVSFELGLLTLLISLLIGVPIGVITAMYQDTPLTTGPEPSPS